MHQFLSEMIFMSEEKLVPKLRFLEFTKVWKSTKIGEIADIVGGGTPRTEVEEYWDGEIKWFTPSEIGKTKYIFDSKRHITDKGLKNSSAKLLPKDTILLSSRATVGEISIALTECSTNQGFQSLITKNNVDNDFIYYLISTIKNEFLRRSSGSTFLEISKNEIKRIPINIPELSEQNKISNLFSAIDNKIEMLEKKHQYYQDFKKYLMQRIFSSQDDKLRFADSDSCWKEISLKDIGTFYRGHSYNSTNVADEGLLVLRSNNIQGNVLDFSEDGLQFVDKDCKKELELQKNDIVICMSNGTRRLVGKSAEYTGNYENKVTVGAFCSIFRTKNKLAKYLFQTESYKKNLYLILAGTNINNLKNSDLEKFKFNIPTNESEINKIHDLFVSIDNKIDYNKKQLEEITLFKKGLLQQMFV